MTKFQQAAVSFLIRCLVIAAVAVINFIIAGMSSGSVQLPEPAILVPLIGLVLSEADTWLVQWEKANNVA